LANFAERTHKKAIGIVGMLDLPEVEEYPDNVVPDRRQGGYWVSGGQKEKEQPQGRSIGADSLIEIEKEQPFDCSFTLKRSVAL